MTRDLFAKPSAARAPAKARAVTKRESKTAPGPHRCAICGGFAPYGKGLPHRGEPVVYFCREHMSK